MYGVVLAFHDAMERRRTNTWIDISGFTLIELLVVVVFIGILATIAIARYPYARERAGNAAATSDLKNAAVFQEDYYSTNTTYADQAALDAGISVTKDVTVTVLSSSSGGYELSAKHAASSTTFCLSSADGAVVDC